MVEFFKRYTGIKNILFFILAILFLVFITKIKDIAILFFAAYVIACSLYPLVDKICMKSKKINRPAATVIVMSGTLLTAFIFVIPIIIVGGHQISSFLNMFPEHMENTRQFLSGIPVLSNFSLNSLDAGSLVTSATDVTSNIVSRSITFSKDLASAFVCFLAGCIIIYYFIADREIVKKGYLSLFPRSMKNKADEILDSISQKVGGYVTAQVVTMASAGLIVFAGLAVLGIDYAIILGLITAVFDLVPVIGPTIALLVIILSVIKMGALKIGLVILVFLFAQWAENNLIRPYIFGKLLNLHPLIIYFFLLVTAQFLGIIGLIFAPAIAATVTVLIEELYIKNIN